MKTTDPRAKEVWNRTLDAVRRERRRRRTRRAALSVAAVMLPVLLMLSRREPTPTTTRETEPPPVTVAEQPALAVMVIRDGVPTLEALSPGDLPDTELHLSLAPILADYRDLSEERF
ncbi:hypothetical protein OVA24_01200 [Luteolibacter sp. SL250]|uniref:hypothetical protein n=1 Tax=Luteolibacter sp. SL250 TaxID=2995170 RepID=UPI00226F55CB|nr:hypothetical protein [Luteolibacter sp. SL250]WAC19994.1 hypothetical protein OVA24_01200 [Luteolibacter sp. SL250]